MDRDSPGEAEWNLSNFSFRFASFLDDPARIVRDDDSTVFELDDRESFFASDDMSD